MNNQKGLPVRQAGQVILILILVMSVALAIGLSVIQRSLSDVSTSTDIEESSRAFSAAEAGIERILSGGTPPFVNFSENNSTASATSYNFPAPPGQGDNNRQRPFECPPGDTSFAKESVAQVWLADPNSSSPTNPLAPAEYYKQTSLDVYWGLKNSTDKAALEVILVYWDGAKYVTRKWYLDQTDAVRSGNTQFTPVNCSINIPQLPNYQCQYRLGGTLGSSTDPGGPLPASPSVLMLLRARTLYNETSQPFAVQAVGTCTGVGQTPQDCWLPPQAKIIVSKGTSGQTRRIIQLCQVPKVVPSYFDYAIFSEDEIAK
ncbi:hypothetical protein A3D83_04810 [Candidatus Daviesbacteria bacterium RIFCSPHIGHO2_02_FULL_41_10]|uniref:Type 4 fimbrial biogenesis protein PilX N-terminal domain-containing protein n=2 Tax=Candidatus Daviesiibacteriota TaxID=1752718 RepID=A0A1F5ISP4_9BACT|nr:MAG: hypothetical protein A2871_00955 [Candidatus Daviesbacteria bacterium RIFCSPHIGHO2_01_FULL_41_23]OGE32957.1 MAG: hypothetical protein A3D83_04810 [Candidatus Daviesbacteria bacterium RIFCSPHIGHO2_02_FULL_41_10]OGE62463.1 MAG: hypothetical protein A2967_01440 [Candidatus Daviesbacteria bacterium RIFCSPLOWO2_01_FULL_41_32]